MSGIRACRVCGCTDECACPEGCWWVEWDLCSTCDGAEGEAIADSIAERRLIAEIEAEGGDE